MNQTMLIYTGCLYTIRNGYGPSYTLRMFKVYEDFQKNYLAIPVIVGKKSEKENITKIFY